MKNNLPIKKAKKLLKNIRKPKNEEEINKLKELTSHKSEIIAQGALKRLGTVAKLEKDNADFYFNIVNDDKRQKVRKEAVSILGRMRDYKIALNYLTYLLSDNNPEIVLQAIRGLLVFKNDEKIKEILKKLTNHKNEIVKNIIRIEYSKNSIDKDTKSNHSSVKEKYKNKIICGDALKILKNVEDNTIHLTFTSPPYYNARDYSIYKSYKEYLNFLTKVFKEVFRVTKDGRFLAVNTSPIIIPRVGRKYSSKRYPIPYDLHCYLTAIGWEFIDDIIWVKPETSVKNRIGGFYQTRKPLMYKPNSVTEQIMIYRKKTRRLIDWNLRAYSEEVIEKSKISSDYERTNIWKIEPTFNNHHSAVFPKKLCDNIVKYYSMINDLVFDPFAGIGTLAKSALDLKRNVFMTEINTTYFNEIMKKLSPLIYNVDFLSQKDFLEEERHES